MYILNYLQNIRKDLLRCFFELDCRLRARIKLEYIFLLLFLSFGVFFAIYTPPGENPDESNHVYRTLQIADGQIVALHYTHHDNNQFVGGQIPQSVVNFFADWNVDRAYSDSSYVFNRERLTHKTKNVIENRLATTKIAFTNTAAYPPTAYLPQIVAVCVSRLLNLPILYMILLGRILALVAVACAIFYSIRIVPIGKWVIFSVGLMPETISQSAAFSADGLTIAVVILGTAYMLKLIFQKTFPDYRQMSLAFIMCALICLVKPLYLPALALMSLLPVFHKHLRQKKAIFLLITGGLLSLLPFALWLHAVNFIKTEHTPFNPTANYYVMKSFVEHHPITFLHTMYHTYFTNQPQINNVFTTLFGAYRQNTVSLPTVFAVASTGALLLSILIVSPRETQLDCNRAQLKIFRTILLLTSFIFWLLVSVVMYITYTDSFSTSIVGVQGRYFIPLLPLLLLAFFGGRITQQRNIKIGLIVCMTIVLFAAASTSYNAYYHILPTYY